ncbi:glycosyltransferase family 4 protein [Aeromonas rivipollensis]|uniref:glycosyltransferase family 4 protein n=1 Tax=Aeromonas rivipollensis TaxID=948519 RepID=UPI003D1F00F7
MNICYICHEYPPLLNGGIGTFTKELAEGLAKQGHNVTVVGFYDQQNSIEDFKLNGVRMVFLKKSKYISSILDRLKLSISFKKINEKYHFDIVECPDFLGWGASIPRGKYVKVTRLHGTSTYFSKELEIENIKYFFWKAIEWMALLSSDNIVSVSHYTAKKTKSIFRLKNSIDIIHNAVTVSDVSEIKYNDKCTKFIFAGSLLKKKGVIELAKAWREFALIEPDATLTFVGKDPENNWPLINEIMSSVSHSVDFRGAIPKEELINLYNKYDCAIFPSHAEAFALAPMEAMDRGIPIIYSELTSGKELLVDGVHGFLIDPKDFNNILNKLLLLSKLDRNSREVIATAAKKHIKENFNFDCFLNKNTKYYENILDRKNTYEL